MELKLTTAERPKLERTGREGDKTPNPFTETLPEGDRYIDRIAALPNDQSLALSLTGGTPGVKPGVGAVEKGGHAELSLLRRQVSAAAVEYGETELWPEGMTVRLSVGTPDKKGNFSVKMYPTKRIIRERKGNGATENTEGTE
jgi:hypothetical protein